MFFSLISAIICYIITLRYNFICKQCQVSADEAIPKNYAQLAKAIGVSIAAINRREAKKLNVKSSLSSGSMTSAKSTPCYLIIQMTCIADRVFDIRRM